ncbi:MAG: QsdR family transcriptional regulator [Thermoleophilaceae bacterium]
MSEARSATRVGRPPAATREQVIEAGMVAYLRGRRVDVQAIAAELGLGRTTIYRWFGSREGLLGEILVRAADPLLDAARSGARGKGGRALLDTFDRFNRSLVEAPALRTFVEQERELALRVITSGAGVVDPHLVGRITALIEEEVAAGNYEPPLEPATLGFAIVRLAEAFLLNDVVAGIRGDVGRLREVEGALLGVRP